MHMQKAGRAHSLPRLALSVVVLAVFSGVPFLNFYRTNYESLAGPSRVLRYYFAVLVIAVAFSLIAKLIFRAVALRRIFLVAAVVTFMVFAYDEIKMLVGSDSAALSIACWACATALAGLMAARLSASAAFMPTMAIVGFVYTVPATIGLVHARAHPVAAAAVALPLTARDPRNVYWIVLDGYPRADVLKKFFDFDNGPFLKHLQDRGFTVYDQAVASFPETIFSIPSTLSLGFLHDRTRPPGRILPQASLYPIVGGQNLVIDTMRAMGYRYVHFQNGYDYLTQCPLEGAICIRGNVESDFQFDEFSVALLSKTPLIDAIALDKENLTIDKNPLLRGYVHDLTDKLDEVRAVGGPFFLYAHILAPHPPVRFRQDCSIRAAAPNLVTWDPADKPAFLDQLRCVNREAVDLLDNIVRGDPKAIIVVQSDHGTAFRGQFKKPFDAWDRLDLWERFGALNAIRMPASCSNEAQGTVDLVNTFARVLSCISDTDVVDEAARLFVVSHKGDMTEVHEYNRDF